MHKLAIVISPEGQVFIACSETVEDLVKCGYIIGGYAETREEAKKLAAGFK